MERTDTLDIQMQNQCSVLPTLEPQVLFNYPPGKEFSLRVEDLVAFCFPEGVKPRMLEKTPSLSELNELVYGQGHLCRDDLSFIFSLKVADNATIYGVCLHVQEFVQKPHTISGVSSPLSQIYSGFNKFLVSAPRCYCILTRVPFFELHFDTLNSIISQERLNRITQFVSEMPLSDHLPSPSTSEDVTNRGFNSPTEESAADWKVSAMPVIDAMNFSVSAAGILSDEEAPSSKWELYSPGSVEASDSSNHMQMRGLDVDDQQNAQSFDSCSSETEKRLTDHTVMNRTHFSSHTPDVGIYFYPRTHSVAHCRSFETLFSSARSFESEVEEDEAFFDQNDDSREDMIMEWARDNKDNLLQLVCGYHTMTVPPRGSRIVFQPLEHLQAIEYLRPPISALGYCEMYIDSETKDCTKVSQAKLKLATAEEAVSLSLWTTATICRLLSLESFLALVTGVLLEKQVVVLCSNLGLLSALVLSIIPMIRPFEWQSLFLPILPRKMMDFLDAPVPFIVGIQSKIDDVKLKTSNLVLVNVERNQVKTCNLPLLPQQKDLISELEPIHSILSGENSIAQRHPVYKCNEVQGEAAAQFLFVMRQYLESLCSDLRSHTITNVQSNDDRVSILLKDSYIDSFSPKDQSFIKLFVETQLFTVLSDSRLSSFENEHHHH